MHDDVLGDVEMVGEDGQFYIVVNGVRIARRENRQWTNLAPGYSVEDVDGGASIAIEFDGSISPLAFREVTPPSSRRGGRRGPSRLSPDLARGRLR
jgi:hypothetical protein